MNWKTAVFIPAVGCLVLVGCQSADPLPWRLIALGTTPLTTALEDGQVVVAHAWNAEGAEDATGWPGMLFPSDTGQRNLQVMRDLRTLPTLTCGDVIRFSPAAMPLTLRQQFGWTDETADSISVQWECLNVLALGPWGMEAVAKAQDPVAAESAFLASLMRWAPNQVQTTTSPYQLGDSIHLQIVTTRPDGQRVGDTVRLGFRKGQPDQVVPALEPGLASAGPGATWTVWSLSKDGFGSEAHPHLRLPAHTPLHFEVQAH